MIVADTRRILDLRDQIKTPESRCEALADTPLIACRIDTIPGSGLVSSSELASEIGTLDRFAGEAGLTIYLDMVSLDHSSGQYHSLP